MLEGLQVKALEAMKNQGMEGLAALMAGQQEVLQAIAREKAELRPHLDQWERMEAGERARLRQGKAGEILDALEAVAQGIAARHKDWFGDDGGAAQGAAAAGAQAAQGSPNGADKAGKPGRSVETPAQDLSQTINMYRGLK